MAELLRKNILLLSAGRRVSLARAFRGACMPYARIVYTADLNPALSAACNDNENAIALPHVLDAVYPDALLRACAELDIGLVVPTIDTELGVLASLRERARSEGTELVVCDADLVAHARDKRHTPAYFERFGLTSPEILHPSSLTFPAIAKPFDGSLSKDITVLRGPADITPKILSTRNIMFMRYLDPELHDEFTCDAYYDKECQLRCVVPRLRVEVRGGEISKGRTCRNELVGMFRDNLGRIPGARGCLTFQFFVHKTDRSAWLIELNPRFGGGFPMSLAAGANYPAWLVSEYLLDRRIESFDAWQDGMTMLRYDAEIIARPS